MLTNTKVAALLAEDKIITANVRWHSIGGKHSENYSLEATVLAPSSNTAGKSINSMLNTIQDVSYLIYKKVRRGPVSFYEEVEKFLIGHEIRYDPQFPVQGKSYVHTFRFHLDDRKHILIEPLTATSPHVALVRAERLALWWIDIRDLQPQYRKVAVVDDVGERESLWYGRPSSVLEQYSDAVILWSKKQRLSEIVLE